MAKLNQGGHIKDDAELHPSYGQPIPRVKMVKGEFVNFSELAGHGDISAKRDISFGNSISDNLGNQPKSH